MSRPRQSEQDAKAAVKRWWSAVRRTLTRYAYVALPRLATVRLAVDAAGLESPGIPHLFSRDLWQIDPRLNEELLDLYGRSEQLLSHQFTLLNHSESFGPEIIWRDERQTPVWQDELHSFDYGLDLALTYRISGEDRYARHLRFLIADWIATNSPLIGPGWRSRATARRVRNWILASDLARANWQCDPEFIQVVAESLALQTSYLLREAGRVREGSDALHQIRALMVAGRFFGANAESEPHSTARSMLFRELERVHADGGYIEPWPSSQIHVAQTVLEWLMFLPEDSRAGFLEGKLRAILAFLEGMLLPDGTPPMFGPFTSSWRSEFANVAALAAVCLGNPVWKSLAEKFGILPYMLLGEEGKARFDALPAARWKPQWHSSPDTGVYRLSDGDSSALVINTRPPASIEDHQDLFGFELFLQGHRVVVDSGACAKVNEAGGQPRSDRGQPTDSYFRSAIAHSILLVDGKAPPAGTIERLESAPSLAEKAESASEPSGIWLVNRGTSARAISHTRACLLIDKKYWVIWDRLEGARPRKATSLLHFYPTFDVEPMTDRAVARRRTFSVTVIPLGQSKPRFSVSHGGQGEFPGWYAPDVGVKYPNSVLALEWSISQTPWAAGYIIARESDAAFRMIAADANTISFELLGKQYRVSTTASAGRSAQGQLS